MATRKMKRYADGGETTEYLPSEQAMDDLASREMPVAETKKAPVVTKEALAKSGLSLREYMNRQLGLKPRGGSPTPSGISSNAAVRKSDMAMGEDASARIPGQNRSGPEGGERVDSSNLSRNIEAAANMAGPARLGLKAAPAAGSLAKAAQAARAVKEIKDVKAAEVAAKAAKAAGKRDKVTNPMAWMSGPKNMDSFKKGGAVKGWGQARGARAAKIV